MNEKQFAIDTPIGKIVAEGFTEPYPEIVIYLKRNDGEVINLSSINYESSGEIIFGWMCSVMSTRIIRAGRLKI